MIRAEVNMYIQSVTQANYNSTNFKSIKLINELPIGKFPADAARSIIESEEIRNLARNLHHKGVDLIALCSCFKGVEILDSEGNKYPEFQAVEGDLDAERSNFQKPIITPFEKLFCAKGHIFDLLKFHRSQRRNEIIREAAFRKIDKFNQSLDING